jgi:hypothetical protein
MKLFIAIVAIVVIGGLLALSAKRRGSRATRPLPPAAPEAVASLRRDVETLCAFGQRNTFAHENIVAAAGFLERELRAAGYAVDRQTYTVASAGVPVDNLSVELRGSAKPDEIVVIGAHYDSVFGSPGADDNASGVAALLALARQFAGYAPRRTLRFVFFANEEPPHFQTHDMGSWQYAKRCRDRGEKIAAMVSVETVGYFDDTRGSQQYPAPLSSFYPDTGNFIGFASNIGSRGLLSRCVKAFRRTSELPVESTAMPEAVPGIGWSDQWAFWQFGWRAIMVTDTAPYRNPNYHRPSDRPHTLDYERLAHVVTGLGGVVEDLTR